MVSQDWPHGERAEVQESRVLCFVLLETGGVHSDVENTKVSGRRSGVLRLWPLLGFQREGQDK